MGVQEASSAAQAVYSRLASVPSIHPSSAKLFGGLELEAGDVVTVKSDNRSYQVPIHAMHLNWHGGVTTTIESTGNEKREPLPALRRKEYALGHGGYGASKHAEEKFKEYETHFYQTDRDIGLIATRAELCELGEAHITAVARINVNADAITAEVSRATEAEGNLSSRIDVNADSITSKVSKGAIASTINQTAQSVKISASKINLDGYVTTSQLDAVAARITNLTTGVTDAAILKANTINAESNFYCWGSLIDSVTISMGNIKSFNIMTVGNNDTNLNHSHSVSVGADGTVTLGEVATNGGSFRIADTKTYKDGVSAAIDSVTVTQVKINGRGYYEDATYNLVLKGTASNGKTKSTTISFEATEAYNAGVASVTPKTVTSVTQNTSGTIIYNASTKKLIVPMKVNYSDGTSSNFSATVDGMKAYNGGYTVGYKDGGDDVYVTEDSSHIAWSTTLRKVGSVSGKVTVTLSNGNSYSRTVSDISAPYVTSVSDYNSNFVTLNYNRVSSGYSSTERLPFAH